MEFESLLRLITRSALPVASIEQTAVRDLIAEADLIWGHDPARELLPLFFGDKLLADIAAGREDEFGHQMLLCFTLDLKSDEPESLRSAVELLKGSCCYQPIADLE